MAVPTGTATIYVKKFLCIALRYRVKNKIAAHLKGAQ